MDNYAVKNAEIVLTFNLGGSNSQNFPAIRKVVYSVAMI